MNLVNNLYNHTVYLDVTNICNLDCDFCMYKKERSYKATNLNLDNIKATDNINNLLTDNEVKKIVISGEGEPLNNIKVIYKIIPMLKNKKLQIVTSGSNKNITDIIVKLYDLSRQHNTALDIRLSVDSFHMEKVGVETYVKIFNSFFSLEKEGNFTFSIRTLLEEKEGTKSIIDYIFKKLNKPYIIKKIDEIDEILEIEDHSIRIIYKNRIKPDSDSDNTMDLFISELERKYGKEFQIGSLEFEENGLNLLIKPDGNVYFWGIEHKPFGNIYEDNISIQNFKNLINENYVLNRLYNIKFKYFINELKKSELTRKKIKNINNPYWIVKELFKDNEYELANVLKKMSI